MNDRIVLLKAMGWRHIPGKDRRTAAVWHPPGRPLDQSFWRIQGYKLPDPFIDANEDYRVLEWMRGHKDWEKFRKSIAYNAWNFLEDYEIGNNARAALWVINGE